jgi:hypothetical protein
VWSELLWNYLGSITNAYRVPLAYVICQQVAPVTDPASIIAGYLTDHERLLQTAPLQGDTYETDNGKVYMLLESLTIKGNYHSYLEPYQADRNGRGSYMALFTHFEGPNVVGMSLEDAYKNIDKLQYTGDRANFLFDSVVDRHVKAYSTIKRLGGDAKDVTDRKKVQDFLSRIKSNKSAIVSAKVQVMANDAMSDDFTFCCDFMRKIVNTVSKANGCVKDRGPGRNTGSVSGGKGELAGLNAQSYPPKKWNKFTARQKIHVWILRGYDPGNIDARGNLKKGSQNTSGSKNKASYSTAKQIAMVVTETCRHIGATSKDGADKDDDVVMGEDDDAEEEGGAGDMFAARRKKKGKK